MKRQSEHKDGQGFFIFSFFIIYYCLSKMFEVIEHNRMRAVTRKLIQVICDLKWCKMRKQGLELKNKRME